jgi:hypothetical protein
MIMLEKIKYKIALFLVKRRYLKNLAPVAFADFNKKALSYLVVVPENDEDFKNSFLVIRYLVSLGKSVTLFISEHKYSVIPEKERYKVLSFSFQQMTKLKIPDPILCEKLAKRNFDVILNLNRQESLFISAVCFIVNSTYRVGFKNGAISNYFNLQIPQNENNSKISYENLLNSLKMF